MTWAGGCRALGWEGGAWARLRDTGTRRGGETSVCRWHGGWRPRIKPSQCLLHILTSILSRCTGEGGEKIRFRDISQAWGESEAGRVLQPVVTDQPRGKRLREGRGRKLGKREARWSPRGGRGVSTKRLTR